MLSRLICLAATLAFVAAAASTRALDKPAKQQQLIKVLIITGDHVSHDWKNTTSVMKQELTEGSDAIMQVDVTEKPAIDLTADNLAKYDVLLLNYRQSSKPPPDTTWSAENKKAFADAIRGGKGLYVHHFASSAFTAGDDWDKEFCRIIGGGWRKQGFHGKAHEYEVTLRSSDHPITKGMVEKFTHHTDELYQNSLLFPDCTVLATAYSDKSKDPKNTGKDEPMIWVSTYGQGRVCNNAMGHDVPAIQDQAFWALLVRGVEWAATGQVKSPLFTALKAK